MWAPEFHPAYSVTHTRDQDITSWQHNFNVNYPFTRRLSFRASSAIGIRENAVLNRQNRNESWQAGLTMLVSSALSTGLKFTRTNQVDVRNEGKPNEVKSFREKESVNLSTSYKKTLLSGIDLSLGASGGLEKNHYSDVRSRGTTQKVDATVRYEAPIGLKTEISYGGSHSLLDSEQGELRSTDESFEHNLSGHMEYEWRGNTFSVDMRRSNARKEYPKEQQTERRRNYNESVDVSTDLALLEDLTTRISFSYSRTRAFYRIEPSKDNDITTRGVRASLTYTGDLARFNTELRSERKRNEYFDVQTGNTYTNSLTASLSRDFGDRFKATLRGRMSLMSHHYDDIDENDQDRDLFDREATLELEYRPAKGVRAGLVAKIGEDQLIYMRTTRTGDNKTSQTYSIQPSITKNFGPRVSVSQRYELSADYTFYTYDPDSNFLIRTFGVTTGLDWRPLDRLKLTITHKYRGQDEGAYVEDESGVSRYGKNSERNDQSLGVRVAYRLFGVIDIEAGHELSVQKKWQFNEGERRLSWEKFDTDLTAKASVDYTMEDGTVLRLSVGKTYRDATNILERQREVWNISLNIDKKF